MRSHDPRHYGKRFMMRLDDSTWEKLEAFSTHFDNSAAEIIRQPAARDECPHGAKHPHDGVF